MAKLHVKTLSMAKEILRTYGMTISRDTVGSGPTGSGDYRVTFRIGVTPEMTRQRAEDLAYYTPDLNDAVNSALDMYKTYFKTR